MKQSNRKRCSLFITYDGLLDPLGSSQILPYLKAIASQEDHLHVLSFEKPERYALTANGLREELALTTIRWTPLIFTRSWGSVGKLWDLLRMQLAACRIAARIQPSVVHARGHAPAQAALLIKQLFGAHFLFDCRGLWVDERVDKGGWVLSNPWHRLQYRVYKWIEMILFSQVDHMVVLTEAVIPEVLRLGVPKRRTLTVIPCCADFCHFQLATPQSRQIARSDCHIPEASLVLGYLGSVGGMYMPEQFLRLVERASTRQLSLQVLVLTPDEEKFRQLMQIHLPAALHPHVHVRAANRDQVARWLPAMDLLVSLIKPSYARIGSSPTKLAEAWATGIPAICNRGVGDVATLVEELDAGMVIDASTEADLLSIVDALPSLLSKKGKRLREAAQSRLSLELAAERYRQIYNNLRA
jgi:glycosyltransferase involved in cell wall biosynthesis